uniref:C2H2-type domain-containing protein n=1 Tax=Meloidogyne floridensis TaxID=298350 RepID=A0A915PEC9_9BILA
MDQNACAECGYTTADLNEFNKHVEWHEDLREGEEIFETNEEEKLLKEIKEEEEEEFLVKKKKRRLKFENLNEKNLTELEEKEQKMEESDNLVNNSNKMLGHLADLGRFLNEAVAATNKNTNNLIIKEEENVENNLNIFCNDNDNNNCFLQEEQTKNNNLNNQQNGEEEEGIIFKKSSKNKKLNNKKQNGNGGGGGKTTHKCPHCTFTTFIAHDNFVGQMYICDLCGMAFSQKANMHRHRGTHSGIKPFECRFCQKKFFRKDQMQEHSMTHIKTGNDFDCPVSGCSFKFSQHNLLKQHLDQKHAISPSLQGQCKLCNLQFSNARRLLMHYQTKHEEYASNDSPVLEGQSPVKRLNNCLSKTTPSPSELPTETSPSSSQQQPPSSLQQNDQNFSFPSSSTKKIGRKPRKRPRLLLSPSPSINIKQQINNNNSILDNNLINSSNQYSNRTKVLPVNGCISFSPATFSDAPTTSSSSTLNGYNVEDLLKLDCGGSDNNTNSYYSSPSSSSLSTKEQQNLQLSTIFTSTTDLKA